MHASPLRIHSIHHVPFEGLGYIADWAREREHHLSATWQHQNDPLPDLSEVDLLIVIGGPMGVGDEHLYPWLSAEKALIRLAIQREIPVLGICLGAQLIADVLGASVGPQGYREIGWFPIQRTGTPLDPPWLESVPLSMDVLHWHGDRFELPENAQSLWSSEACPNQGFICGSALALQFHMEITQPGARELCDACSDELGAGGKWVQSPQKILADSARFEEAGQRLRPLLDRWLGSL